LSRRQKKERKVIFMCVEEEPAKTIAKKASVVTAEGTSLIGVTVMGPAKRLSNGRVEVRVYGKNIPETGKSPWVAVKAAHDRMQRQILL
jgi:hypothetical protein